MVCGKLLNFDKILSPSKSTLIFNDQYKLNILKLPYTECDILEHAIIFWPNDMYFIKIVHLVRICAFYKRIVAKS